MVAALPNRHSQSATDCMDNQSIFRTSSWHPKWRVLLAFRQRIFEGFFRTRCGSLFSQPPPPLPPLPPDLPCADRAQRASVLGNLDRSWLAAGMDDLRPAPLRDLTGRRLAVVAGKAKPTATLQVTA